MTNKPQIPLTFSHWGYDTAAPTVEHYMADVVRLDFQKGLCFLSFKVEGEKRKRRCSIPLENFFRIYELTKVEY